MQGFLKHFTEYYIPGKESRLTQEFLTQKLNLQNAVSIQQGSYLPIPIKYTIQIEILSFFHSPYLKKSQIFENCHFSHKPFFSTPKII